MKSINICLFALLLLTNNLIADFNIKVRLNFENELGVVYDKLVFGAVSGATDGIDEFLGEMELPPFPPPEIEILAFMNLDTISAAGLYSYLDFRSVPEDVDDFLHQYRIVLFKRSNSLITISWQSLLPQIKSAIMADRFDGIMFKAQMKDSNQVRINNQFLDRIDFNIKVWYSKTGSSVNQIEDNIILYPNPAKSNINIEFNELFYGKMELFNSLGEKLGEYLVNNDTIQINIEKFTTGNYYIVLSNNTKIHTKKFIIE